MMAKYPDELTCDMAETYGVFDIKRVPVKLLATLAVGLRDDSQTVLLAKLIDVLRGVEYDNPLSLTAQCFADGPTGSTTAPKEQYEIFDSPEAFKKRWAELSRN